MALGKKDRQTPAIVIERNEIGKKMDKKSLEKELLKIAKNSSQTAQIKSVYFCDQMPVDVRHNIKIDRLKLANEISRGKI